MNIDPQNIVNKWFEIFNDKDKKLNTAIYFQKIRCENIIKYWNKIFDKKYEKELNDLTDKFLYDIKFSKKESDILTSEARFSRELYQILKKEYKVQFTRQHRNNDIFNKNLDQGNYLAYGLAAIVLWNLGIPHSLPVLHGKTRRGALVFDVADIIKDAYIMPNAFLLASKYKEGLEFREHIIDVFDEEKALKKLFNSIKEVVIQ